MKITLQRSSDFWSRFLRGIRKGRVTASFLWANECLRRNESDATSISVFVNPYFFALIRK